MHIPYYRCAAGWISICQATTLPEMKKSLMLIEKLQIQRVDDDTFRADPGGSTSWMRLFGGQVVAQALLAAYNTVDSRPCHSLHCYFVRPGSPTQPMEFLVSRVRDGGSFTTRHVAVRQEAKEILTLSASFHVPENGFFHQVEMPAVPAPDSIAREPVAQGFALADAIEMLELEPRPPGQATAMPATKRVWLRVPGCAGASLREQHVALAFASDLDVLGAAMRPHGLFWWTKGLQAASLDHSIWFHRPFDISEWHLFVQESPVAYGARGFVKAAVFARNGDLVVSVAQEGLLRMRPASE
jgi:acyl-CoA thioesterase-2